MAQAQPTTAGLSAQVVHRRLVERDEDGRRLVTESGELLRLQGEAGRALRGGGALRGFAAVAAGTLDYRGQTQAGVPLSTDSAHRDLALGAAWRPVAPASWGEAWLTLQVLQQRRRIASTPAARGLRETSMLVMPGLRWTHALEARGWRWRPGVEVRASVHHRLDVDFGGLFDDARLTGGGRRELLLSLEAGPAGSPWKFGIEWSHARQSASAVDVLERGGVAVGSVHQPRIAIDDVALRVRREF